MSQVRNLKKGDSIFSQGERAEEAYLIRKGLVRLIRYSADGPLELGILGPGSIFGEAAFTKREARFRYASAVAAEATEVLTITRQHWDQLLAKMPETMVRFVTQMIEWLHQTPAMSFGQRPRYPIMQVCAVLQLMATAQVPDEMAGHRGQAKKADHLAEVDLEYDLATKRIKEILSLPTAITETSLKKLESVNLIKIGQKTKTRRSKSVDPATFREKVETKKRPVRMIMIREPERLTLKAKRMVDEWPELAVEGAGDLLDLEEFARAVESDLETIYKKMARGEIPPHIFLMHRDTALGWAKEMGQDFFRKSRRRQLRPEDLAVIEDILLVDDAALQEAISRVGVQNLAHILKEASDKVRAKVLKNLSQRMANMIQAQMESLSKVDERLAIDQEHKLIKAIKDIKGIG